MTLFRCVGDLEVAVRTLPPMRTGSACRVTEAGVGRHDSNAIGVAYREARVKGQCLECLLAEAKEEAELQMAPQMSSCPTWRPPRQPKVKKNDPPPPPPDSHVVEILRDLGCSHDLLTRLQERLAVVPPSAPPLIPGSQAKRLADLQASLARL